jgi:hypothetical protein
MGLAAFLYRLISGKDIVLVAQVKNPILHNFCLA